MRLAGLALAIALAILVGAAPRGAAADSAEDTTALAQLDVAFAAAAAPDAAADVRAGALDLVHKVIERVSQSYAHPYAIRELAKVAEQRVRELAPRGAMIDPADLAEGAVEAVLGWIADPYASYTARKMRARGNRLGDVGIEATVEDGRIKVIAPLEGGPAQEAGVKPGDLIIEVDRTPVSGLSIAQAMKHLQGPLGSLALLNIRRGNRPNIEIKVPRTKFQVRALRHETLDRLAYIRIAFFGPETEKLLREALLHIRQELGGGEATGYIIDLRDNPGGLVGQAILVADAFLEDGMIVTTRGRDATRSQQYKAYRGDFVNGRPIVVLINRSSASAAEILAAALKDNGRAVVIGDRSFGKGVVQTVFPFGAWGQIRITTHTYVTAGGRQIQRVGVRPHVVIGDNPQPQFQAETLEASRCPPAGPAHDALLGCAIVLLQAGGTVEGLLKALPR